MHGLCYHIWVMQTVFLLVVHSHHTTQKIWHNSLPHLLQHEGFFSEMLMWLPHGILTDNIILSDRARCSCLFGSLWFGISRWHTIRSPKLWQAEQSFRSNKDQILKERFDCSSSCGSCNFSDIVREFRPLERWIGPRSDGLPHGSSSLLVDKLDADGSQDEEDDDVIEEC